MDIAIITETYFTQRTRIYIPGFKLIKTNHLGNTVHGGVVILIETTKRFQVVPKFFQDCLQLCAKLKIFKNIPIAIAEVYCPLRHNLINTDFLNYFSTFSNNLIIDRGYNVKHQSWSYRTNNPHGHILHNFISFKQFRVLDPPIPTHWPTSSRRI